VDSRERAFLIGQLAGEKKAGNVTVVDLTGLTDIADFFVIADGTSERQVRTVAETIELEMKNRGFRQISVEGMDEGRWVIIDYGDVIAHVFLEPLRELYDLESLWIEAKRYGIEGENKI
jgi:ribosome-associated protein